MWYTLNSPYVYAILLTYPQDSVLILGAPKVTNSTNVTMLGYTGAIHWSPLQQSTGLMIDLHSISPANLPSSYAWVFKIENIQIF